MTPAENTELREFISEELQKLHDRVDQVYVGQLDFQDHVAGHFGKVYARLDDGSTRLDDVSTRLDDVSTRLDDVSTRLSRVETQFEEMRSDFRAFGEGLESANRKREALRSDMNRGFAELRSDMNREFWELRKETRDGFRSWGERVVALEDRAEGREPKRG